jgi:hypothetical protein
MKPVTARRRIPASGVKEEQQRRKQLPGLYVPIGRSAEFNLVTPEKTCGAAEGTTAAPAAKFKTPELKGQIGKASESGINGNTTDGYVVTLTATVQQMVLKTAEAEDERFPSL